MDENVHVKILFEVESEGEFVLESMWAVPDGTDYRLDNIPFYAYSVSWNDVVSAELRHEMLYFTGVVATGGHSTIRLWFADPKDIDAVRTRLDAMGCSSECNGGLVAVDVPQLIDYDYVKAFLDKESAKNVLDFEEACLA